MKLPPTLPPPDGAPWPEARADDAGLNWMWLEEAGRFAFDNETLAQAARAFSRYSDIRILVSADVENQTVTGLYVTNDPVGFAKAAALSLGLRAEIERHEIRLSKAEGAGQ